MSKADNKIRIIDLLNKIANGEEVPKTVKYNEKEYNYHDYSKNYYYINDKEECLFDDDIAFRANNEVEILEDNTEEIEELDTDIHIDSFMDAELNFNKIAQEINKLGKGIRELRKEKE